MTWFYRQVPVPFILAAHAIIADDGGRTFLQNNHGNTDLSDYMVS